MASIQSRLLLQERTARPYHKNEEISEGLSGSTAKFKTMRGDEKGTYFQGGVYLQNESQPDSRRSVNPNSYRGAKPRDKSSRGSGDFLKEQECQFWTDFLASRVLGLH